jgi:hypothetical protein
MRPPWQEAVQMNEPKDPRMSGKIAMYVLVFIAALVALMVWVAG